MRGRWLVGVVAVVLGTACAPAAPAAPPDPPAPRLDVVALPGGGEPQALAVAGDGVLVGVRGGTAPGLLRYAADGTAAAVPTRASTPYGATASWYALTSDGTRILAVGGDRGGAHGNVRWSVWTGTAAGVAEQTQAFTTFGGWGAGDLVGAVLAPTGPALVGSWQSDDAGLDVAVWTPDGDDWTRRPSTGTALASTRAVQGFATAATRGVDGVLVTGWQVGGPGHPGQAPVVWTSPDPGAGPWVRTPLPDAGAAGVAVAGSCDASGCAVTGRVDGVVAVWRLADGVWARVAGLPAVGVGDTDPLPAPVRVDGRLLQVVPDRGGLALLDLDRATRTAVTGATGPVTAAVAVGPTVFVLAGEPRRLWRAELPGGSG